MNVSATFICVWQGYVLDYSYSGDANKLGSDHVRRATNCAVGRKQEEVGANTKKTRSETV